MVLGGFNAFKITIQPAPGVEILQLSAGPQYVASGDSFKFVIRPSLGTFTTPPSIITGRPGEAALVCTPNGDGTYTAIVRNILQSLNLQINAITVGKSEVPVSGVWSSGRELHIVASVSGQATVYTLTGTRVKTIPLVAGETVVDSTLPPGIYLVALEGQNSKVIIR
jgi:hypothetical protein